MIMTSQYLANVLTWGDNILMNIQDTTRNEAPLFIEIVASAACWY